MTANTTSAPAAAPSVASDNARQLASLATRTGWPSKASRSRCSGCPLSQVELAFFMTPAALRLPGVPMPMVNGVATALAAMTKDCSAASVAR